MENAVWRKIAIHPVGGLIQVGFAEQSDLLLVLSHNGRGIFDCLTGERIARDEKDVYSFFDENSLIAKGFAELEGKKIKTAGLYGGILSANTQDGWRLSADEDNEIYLSFENDENRSLIDKNDIVDLRAFGFSETGKSFIVAMTADLGIFSRKL